MRKLPLLAMKPSFITVNAYIWNHGFYYQQQLHKQNISLLFTASTETSLKEWEIFSTRPTSWEAPYNKTSYNKTCVRGQGLSNVERSFSEDVYNHLSHYFTIMVAMYLLAQDLRLLQLTQRQTFPRFGHLRQNYNLLKSTKTLVLTKSLDAIIVKTTTWINPG